MQKMPASAAGAKKTVKLWHAGTLTYTTGGLMLLFFWLLFGDFSWAMRDRSVGPMASWYLSSIGVPSLVFAVLMTSFPQLVSLIFVPIISVHSDRCRSRWGRRIPYLLITTPIAVAGMLGLAATPFAASWLHGHFPDVSAWVVSTICFSIFWGLFEIATIAGGAVFGGLLNDVVPKEVIGRFQGMFRAISLLDGIIFNTWLMGYVPTYFAWMMLGIGVFYGISFMWMCFKVKEGDYPPPEPRKEGHSHFKNLLQELKDYFRQCFTNSYYLSVFLLLILGGGAFIPINTFAIPYSESLGITMETYGYAVAIIYSISLILAYPLGWLADIIHPLRLAIVTLFLYTAVSLYGGFFADNKTTFMAVYVLHGVISGSYFTGTASMMQRLYPFNKYAQFASASGMLSAPIFSVFGPFVGLVIDQSGGVFRYTFLLGGIVALLAAIVSLYVNYRFVKLGGNKNYVAPEVD